MEKESLQLPLQSDTKDFSFDHLKEINDAMLDYPKDFHMLKSSIKYLKNVENLLKKRGARRLGSSRATCICNHITRWNFNSFNRSR